MHLNEHRSLSNYKDILFNYLGGRLPVRWANTFRLEEEIGDRMNYLVSIADKFEN